MTKSHHMKIDMVNPTDPSEIIPQPDVASKLMPYEPDEVHRSVLDQLVDYAQKKSDLFHDCNNICYAHNLETHETRRIDSKSFKQWLTAAYYREQQKSIKNKWVSGLNG
jgi:hypothetical protein